MLRLKKTIAAFFFMCSMFSGLWESEHEIQSTMHNVDWNEYRWWKMHKLQKLRSRKPSQPIKQNDSLQSINELLLSVVIFSPLDLMFSVWFGFGLVRFGCCKSIDLFQFNSPKRLRIFISFSHHHSEYRWVEIFLRGMFSFFSLHSNIVYLSLIVIFRSFVLKTFWPKKSKKRQTQQTNTFLAMMINIS